MITTTQKPILISTLSDNSIKYTSAGCFFTDEKLVLCGYQANKKNPSISGFGGKKNESDKTYIDTAIRETLEELFDIIPDKQIIKYIILKIIHKKIIVQNNYYMLVYTLDDLELILDILIQKEITSKLYDVMPRTISELIFKRKINEISEISHLCLLPNINKINIHHDFVQDINSFQLQK